MSLTASERRVNERSTAIYSATLTNEVGDPIAKADLTTLTLRLYDEASGSHINGRGIDGGAAQDVLTAGSHGVGIHATSGLLTWTLAPEDNAIIDADLKVGAFERHIALFEWTWDSGSKAGKHEIAIEVENLGMVA